MRTWDGRIGIFLLVTSSYYCYLAIRLGLGGARNPGPGFLPFLAGVSVFALSIVLIATSPGFRSHPGHQRPALFKTRACLVLACLLFFGLFVEKAGFFVCSFLFCVFVLLLNGIRKWSVAVLAGALICAGTYLLFNTLLHVKLPLGILDF